MWFCNNAKVSDVLTKYHWQVKMPEGTLSSYTKFFHYLRIDTKEITSCNQPSPSFLFNLCPPHTPACEIPSRTWHASQNLHWVSLKRENTDLGWSSLHCHKICHYRLIQVVEEICDQQSMNKIRSPYISNFFLQVKKGKR